MNSPAINKFQRNIVGCLALAKNNSSRKPDWETANVWFSRSKTELTEAEQVSLFKATIEEILRRDGLDIADKLNEQLPEKLKVKDYQNLRLEHEDRIRAENEQRRQEEEKLREAEAKVQAKNEFEVTLLDNFLSVHDRFATDWDGKISPRVFRETIVEFVKNWFKARIAKSNDPKWNPPDREQAWAIGCGTGNTIVVARAGSGKTSTIVNRAIFLSEHCGIANDEIVLLAFNKLAIKELTDRLEKRTQRKWPHVLNFHQLAWSIVHPDEEMLSDSDKDERMSAVVQEIINERIRDPEIAPRIRELMLMRWKDDWESIEKGGDDKSKAEHIERRKSFPRESLGRDYVESHGEKVIANFLFEHDVPYEYERAHKWDERKYRPDFTVSKTKKDGVIIEYFGMKGVPSYDRQIEEKRKYWEKRRNKWKLIEIYPPQINDAGFENWLKAELEKHGFNCRKLTEDEVWEKAKNLRPIDSFTRSMSSFIGRARKKDLSADQLSELIRTHLPESEVEKLFLELSLEFYEAYLERLKLGYEDFDGLISRAAKLVDQGTTAFHRKSGNGDLAKMKFLLIDEYQDFSQLFDDLVQAIRRQNENISLFCVGDDWQAINGFAGADLKFFDEFEGRFTNAKRISVSTNYRSCPEIVELGNRLMQSSGGTVSVASRTDAGRVFQIDLAKFFLSEPERREKIRNDDAALLRLISAALKPNSVLVEKVSDKRAVALLSRMKRLTSRSIFAAFRNLLNDEGNRLVDVETTHRFKGKQSRTVIVSDVMFRRYPLVHPDWVFTRIFGDTLKKIIEDEKRLFYVALSRAEKTLVLVTDSSQKEPCPFFEKLGQVRSLDWSLFGSDIDGSKQVIVQIGNGPNAKYLPLEQKPTRIVQSELAEMGFRYQPGGWPHYKNVFDSNSFDLDQFILEYKRVWNAGGSHGFEIRILDGNEELLGSRLI